MKKLFILFLLSILCNLIYATEQFGLINYNTNLYKEPKFDSNIISELNKNERVQILHDNDITSNDKDVYDMWYKVTTKEKKTGWIHHYSVDSLPLIGLVLPTNEYQSPIYICENHFSEIIDYLKAVDSEKNIDITNDKRFVKIPHSEHKSGWCHFRDLQRIKGLVKRVEEFCQNGFDFDIGKSFNEINLNLGQPLKIEKENVVNRSDPDMVDSQYTAFYDGIIIYGYFDVVKNKLIFYQYEITANKYPMKFGLKIGSPVEDLIKVFGDPVSIKDNVYIYYNYLGYVITKVRFRIIDKKINSVIWNNYID